MPAVSNSETTPAQALKLSEPVHRTRLLAVEYVSFGSGVERLPETQSCRTAAAVR